MIHNPKILILDEPINGLDPAGVVEIMAIFWIVVAAFATMPIMFGFVTYINAAAAGWDPYLTDLRGTSTALLVIGFSFTVCWVFGREYTDKTISELLVKPVSKLYVVLSKFIVIFLWDLLLAFFMFAVVSIMGFLIGLKGGTWLLIVNSLLTFMAASLLTMAVSTISALLANVSKGYLAPIGLGRISPEPGKAISGYN